MVMKLARPLEPFLALLFYPKCVVFCDSEMFAGEVDKSISTVLMQTHLSVGPSAMMDAASCDVMMPLWNHANAMLGQKAVTEEDCGKLELFYNWRSDDYYNETQYANTTMFYVPIWKNAHQNIACNAQHGHEYWEPDLENSQAFSYSFVREPLPRASSAYSELEFRIQDATHGGARKLSVSASVPDAVFDAGSALAGSNGYANDRAQEMRYLRYPEGSKSRASASIKDILGLRFEPTFYEVWHFFSQIGPLRNYSLTSKREVNYVGRLERLNEPDGGWASVSNIAGETLPWDDDCAESHIHTDASSGSIYREAMNELLAEKGTEWIAMTCSAYLPDEVCLGYPVPGDECVAAGFAETLTEWEEVVMRVREAMCPDIADMETLQP